MEGTYDPEADCAYLRLVATVEVGASRRQAVVRGVGLKADLVLDIDENDRILGIEIFDARDVLREDTIAALRQLP